MSANDSGNEPLDAAAARRILELGFSTDLQARVGELLNKLKNENITSDERAELEELNRSNHFLTVLKSKARQILRDAAE